MSLHFWGAEQHGCLLELLSPHYHHTMYHLTHSHGISRDLVPIFLGGASVFPLHKPPQCWDQGCGDEANVPINVPIHFCFICMGLSWKFIPGTYLGYESDINLEGAHFFYIYFVCPYS